MTTSRKAALGAATLAGAALFQFWGNATHGYIASSSLFYWWGFQWVNPQSETEHAWLVLALSLYLLAGNLKREADSAGAAIQGFAGAAGGILLHALGFVAQQPRVSIVGLLLFLWGIVSLWGGRRWARASAFPIGFMVFAIPVNALDTVGFWLQMGVVRAGEHLAHLAGIGVIRNGTQLFGPDGRYQYDVVAACSGIRSLMALTALSLFVGYLWLRPVWLRVVVLLASVPLVFAGNVARITSIVLAAQWGGRAWGDRVHDVMGYGVFVIVLGGIVALAELLSRLRPRWARSYVTATPGESVSVGRSEAVGPALGLVALIFCVGAFLSYRSSLPPDERTGVLLAADGLSPVELPTYLGSEWMGHRVEPEPIERTILPPDTGFSRKLYVNLDHPGEHVLLSIVLSGRDRSSIHRPELCLVGQGWTIDAVTRHRFSYPGEPAGAFEATLLDVHRHVQASGGARVVPEIVTYWFVGDNRVFASQSARIAYDAWIRVVHGRAPRWAYVFLQTGAEGGRDAAIARLQAVLDRTLPHFQPSS